MEVGEKRKVDFCLGAPQLIDLHKDISIVQTNFPSDQILLISAPHCV